MTGYAFILMFWLAGKNIPVMDSAMYVQDLEGCQAAVKVAETMFPRGMLHPMFRVPILGVHVECIEVRKPLPILEEGGEVL